MRSWKVLILFLVTTIGYAQLSDFNLEVTKTDESCLGNGTLTFTTSNTNPLASLLYTVYKYPNLTAPVSVLSNNSLGSLNAGNYKVVARQLLNTFSNTQEQDISILDISIPVSYTVTSSNLNCMQGGQVNIATTSGTAVLYEIISGPVIRPLQSSNVFGGLPEGTYNIRVFDACGEGDVTTYTLILDNNPLIISEPSYAAAVGDCNSVLVANSIEAPAGTALSYPLTIEYTIHTPDGNPPTVINRQFASGNPTLLELVQEFQIFGDNSYTYDIKVTDNCNMVYEKPNVLFAPAPVVDYEDIPISCGEKYLSLSISNHIAPVTVSFLNAPAGFDPIVFNASHPGPFDNSVFEYGGDTMAIPEGLYEIEVTDACGRKGTVTAEIVYDDPLPSAVGRNNGCFSLFGRINASVPDRDIISASIIAAPAAYTPSLPNNVSASIALGKLQLTNMPLGTYQIVLTDECGIQYAAISVEVPPFVESGFTAQSAPDCTAQSGGVSIKSGNGSLTSVIVTVAPAGFGALPQDVSFNINGAGEFYMATLPTGNYIFICIDECGIEHLVPVDVAGYQPDHDPFTFVPNCGSFDIIMSDASPLTGATYWFQKLNPTTGQWGHPATGQAYIEGTVPVGSNSQLINNNATRHNLTFSGTFRIIKSFESFNNGSEIKNCLEVLGDFNYSMDLRIANAYTLACAGNADDVYIEAVNGLQPYTYKITKKNGADFIIDNGTNNIFSNLQPGIYNFEVQDACGNIDPSILNIALLPSLVEAATPQDMVVCTNTGNSVNHNFSLHSQDSAILESQTVGLYSVTYHLTQADADSGANNLPDNYANTANNQIVYARIVHNSISLCHAVVSFKLVVNQYPVLAMPTQFYVCEDATVTISADAGFDTYLWSTGETTRSIIVSAPGTYNLSVANVHGSTSCPTSIDIIVSLSAPPVIVAVDTSDWTDDKNTIAITAQGVGSYEYSLDNINYQDGNVFENLSTGLYTVYVKDKNNCGLAFKEVVLLNYPNFFTPNGDGYNEKWRVKYSAFEPNMKVYIYDKYGKLIADFRGTGEGWDGTFNGLRLPSTDYWFVVEREDGRVFKGHFSMLR